MTDHGTHLDQMRAQAPLVHNITNYVAMNIMANVLLAVGGVARDGPCPDRKWPNLPGWRRR